jgi:hypothetical protein
VGDRGAEVVVKLIVEEKGCRLRSREHAGPSLVSFDSSPLYSVVVGICAKDADVIDVLVAVGWWWVLVCAELVASADDAGVKETGLGFVVVADLGRTAVAPWVTLHISWVGWAVVWTWYEACVREMGLKWLSCWSRAWLRGVKCGGASVRRFLSMELRVG